MQGWSVHMQSKYQVSIRLSGEIIEMKKIGETSIRAAKSDETQPQLGDQMILRGVDKPITKVTADGVEVTINFTIENRGRRRKVHPLVNFRVAQLVGSRFEEHDVSSPEDWIVELSPNTIHPIAFTKKFADGSVIVLTKPPHKVRVKLIPFNAG